MLIIEAMPGEHVETVAARAIVVANQTSQQVSIRHNDTVVPIISGDNPTDVYLRWHRQRSA